MAKKFMQKSTILTHFCHPEIPGIKQHQSRNSGLAKKAGIPGFKILRLQSLMEGQSEPNRAYHGFRRQTAVAAHGRQ